MAFDESKHPRDDDGKFTDKAKTENTHLSKGNDDGKISFARKFGKIMKAVLVAPLMLTPGPLSEQTVKELRKSIRSFEKRIAEHTKNYEDLLAGKLEIKDPKKKTDEYWKKEIINHKNQIEKAYKEIESRGDKNDDDNQ